MNQFATKRAAMNAISSKRRTKAMKASAIKAGKMNKAHESSLLVVMRTQAEAKSAVDAKPRRTRMWVKTSAAPGAPKNLWAQVWREAERRWPRDGDAAWFMAQRLYARARYAQKKADSEVSSSDCDRSMSSSDCDRSM